MQQVGIEPGRARGITSKPSMYSPVLVPANIFQKQEQLQLAEASFSWSLVWLRGFYHVISGEISFKRFEGVANF